MRNRDIAIAGAIVGSIAAFATFMVAAHVHQVRENARQEATIKRLEAGIAAKQARRLPAGKPYVVSYPGLGVTITCRTSGSRIVDGEILPLDLNKAPQPGDLYVRTCVGEKLHGAGPVG